MENFHRQEREVRKMKNAKNNSSLANFSSLAVQKSSHSDRLLPAYFVFPSRTQKAADETRISDADATRPPS